MKTQKQQTNKNKKIVKGNNKAARDGYGCLPYYPH